jgi:hypothetical protein
VLAGTELLLNDLPLNPKHMPLAVLWGINYVLFSWVWLRKTGIAYYPFLDPTIPAAVSIKVHFMLISVLSINFGLGLAVATAAASLPLAARACFVSAQPARTRTLSPSRGSCGPCTDPPLSGPVARAPFSMTPPHEGARRTLVPTRASLALFPSQGGRHGLRSGLLAWAAPYALPPLLRWDDSTSAFGPLCLSARALVVRSIWVPRR